MAIRVRYGDVGDLGRLAVQTGQGQDFWRRFQAEQQLVSGIRQQQQAQAAQQLNRMRLRQAADMQRQQAAQSGLRAGGPQTVRSPFAAHVQAQQPSTQAGQFSNLGLDPRSQDTLQVAMQMGDRDLVRQVLQGASTAAAPGQATVRGGGTQFQVGPEGDITGFRRVTDTEGREQIVPIPEAEMRQRGGFAGPGERMAQAPEAPSDDAQAKQLTLEMLMSQARQAGVEVPSSALQSLLQGIDNPAVSQPQFRLLAERLVQSTAQQQQAATSANQVAVDPVLRRQQITGLTRRRDALFDALIEQGIDPESGPPDREVETPVPVLGMVGVTRTETREPDPSLVRLWQEYQRVNQVLQQIQQPPQAQQPQQPQSLEIERIERID